MTTPKLPPKGNSTTPPGQALFLKILFILLILLLLPELVDSRGSNNSTKKRRKLTVAYNILRDGCSYGSTIRDDDGNQIDVTTTTATTATATAVTNRNDCSRILIEENEMCITRCMSDVCFEKVYAEKLLEMGEVDEIRERYFEKCVKDNIKAEQAEARRAIKR
mmetsp:Transcript_14136/g.16687  ORF Transcript_14136/g.16687 Transcript_14136/m.16687 type:complete len:164 (-) Transcript_14136:216-707(-)|eukprot:CAMPEP_0198252160 /NCGR_PEP_ID=MMETSP1447-20131203/2732_1 /TAXON_ID=420782 /ORGANISM="Chaetoceros dichaeta, Strain CCMP1751" /LENGTH=163 /DNA_ID=CAMNT_0043937327 /DNA_START=59 /DNA_END=550 /DNA_ORIENTATION=-